jgi:hypothetical protein
MSHAIGRAREFEGIMEIFPAFKLQFLLKEARDADFASTCLSCIQSAPSLLIHVTIRYDDLLE